MTSMGTQRLFSASNVTVALLAVGMWASAFLLPVPVPDQPLRVAVPLWPGAEPWVLARAQGRLRPEEVSLIEINWTSAAMRAVGNRVVDAAILSLDEALLQMQQGHPLRILMVTDVSRGADAVLVREMVKDLPDLKGRKAGFEPRTGAARLFSLALREAGISPGEVGQVVLNATELQDARGQLPADAIVCSEPWQQRLLRLGLRPVYDSSRPGAEVVRVLVAHADAVVDHREELLTLVRAHLEWMPRLAGLGRELEPVLRREGVTREEFARILSKIEVPDLEQNRRWLARQDPWLEELWEGLRLDVGERGGPVAGQVFDASFLEVMP